MIPPLTPIGRIAGKHGFRGELNLVINRDQARKMIKKGNFLFVEFDGKGVPFLIETVSASGNIVKLADIGNEKEAAGLNGRQILIETSKAGKNAASPFEGLIGFSIHDVQHGNVGKVILVEEFPQGLMLTLQRNDGEILIPAVEDWITAIDEGRKTITMKLPEGLIDL